MLDMFHCTSGAREVLSKQLSTNFLLLFSFHWNNWYIYDGSLYFGCQIAVSQLNLSTGDMRLFLEIFFMLLTCNTPPIIVWEKYFKIRSRLECALRFKVGVDVSPRLASFLTWSEEGILWLAFCPKTCIRPCRFIATFCNWQRRNFI